MSYVVGPRAGLVSRRHAAPSAARAAWPTGLQTGVVSSWRLALGRGRKGSELIGEPFDGLDASEGLLLAVPNERSRSCRALRAGYRDHGEAGVLAPVPSVSDLLVANCGFDELVNRRPTGAIGHTLGIQPESDSTSPARTCPG
jgi:hypothetical protein